MAKGYSLEQKATVLKRAAEIGAAAAAKEAGVSYQSVLKWTKEGVEKIKAIPDESIEAIDAQITSKEEEIAETEATLKTLKAELKSLLKAKEKAEKEKALLEEAEKKKQMLDALMKSGKSMDEILTFLK